MSSPANHSRNYVFLALGLVLIAAFTFIFWPSGDDDRKAFGPGRYVALGDSFTAGMGIPPRTSQWTPPECQQSSVSYPHLIEAEIAFTSFADGACSGATVPDMTAPQVVDAGNTNPPQFDLLTGNESFVTLSIGGNDSGFWGVVLDCFQNSDPAATPCRDKYLTSDGANQLERRTDRAMVQLDTLIPQLKSKAPDAKIFLVGYQQIAPSNGQGCEGEIPASPSDLKLFDNWQKYLNTSMADVAEKHDIRYVDVYTASKGHDACAGEGERWIEPMVDHQPGVKLHPNAAGERAMADQIIAAYKSEAAGS